MDMSPRREWGPLRFNRLFTVPVPANQRQERHLSGAGGRDVTSRRVPGHPLLAQRRLTSRRGALHVLTPVVTSAPTQIS